ncbi:glycosyltransferase family 2 protein [Priestia flexa]|uniref:glycosyltransferase family 2 protein n=1 Tax=Priestia flexa TaxID=86664 RepID=UPI0010FBFA27|nr:glycosyltransferase [Priestia flexa]QCS53922.1 glycosyltransferase [Priestia flexa]
MLISVIVPIYNAEKHLNKCLESLRKQIQTNLEIILINDGSTDKSAAICDEYQQLDNRFKLINKPNGGVSSARNVGLKAASGQYVGFIDPDDFVELDMFAKLYSLIIEQNADISACGYFKEDSNGSLIEGLVNRETVIMNSSQALNRILNNNSMRGFLWNKLFSMKLLNGKKGLIKEVSFNENVHFCEDLLFCCQAILNSDKVVYDNMPLYHYVIHEDNVSKKLFSLKKVTALYALEEIINLVEGKKNIDIKLYKSFYMHINISLLANGIDQQQFSKNKYIKNLLNENLYKYGLKDMKNKTILLSCFLARINVKLFYFMWKKTKKNVK